MAATRPIPPDYAGEPVADSADIEARRKLGAQRERRGPTRIPMNNGATAPRSSAVPGGAALRGGSL